MPKEKTKPKYLTKALRCPDGTRKYIRGKTQAELDRKVREAQAQLGMGININDNTTVAELAQIWVDAYKKPHVKPQSLKNTLVRLNYHILPHIGGLKVRDVRPADCARVMAKCAHLAKGVQSAILSTMRALFNCAIENNIIAKSPVTSGVKSGGSTPTARVPLTREQTAELCRVAMDYPNDRLYTFVLLCCFAGLRRGEALGLNYKNINLDAGVIYVREQYVSDGTTCRLSTELKTASSRRDVPIPPFLIAHLASIKDRRSDGYIFDVENPCVGVTFASALRAISGKDAAGREKGKTRKQGSLDFYVHPHLLRHTYATRCFESGMDVKEVQYLLGHSKPTMTMEIYVHYLAQARQESTARKIEKAFSTPLLAVVGQ